MNDPTKGPGFISEIRTSRKRENEGWVTYSRDDGNLQGSWDTSGEKRDLDTQSFATTPKDTKQRDGRDTEWTGCVDSD